MGRARWTLRLLENKVVELGIVECASDSTIRRTLKKTVSTASPATLGDPAEGQQRLRRGDGRCARGLHAASRSGPPAGVPGRDLQATHRQDARADPVEAGTRGPCRLRVRAQRHRQPNLFMPFAPLEGWHHIKVTDCHTAIDYAHVLKDLADIHFPHAKTIVLTPGPSNVHSKASPYEAFPAAEARRLVERFEWHYSPRHCSWPDLAESDSAFYPPNASTAVSPTNRPSSTRSRPGSKSALRLPTRLWSKGMGRIAWCR
jgi:hypothetical protein